MKTEIVDVSPTRKELKIEIEPAEVRAEYERVSNRYASAATVPGFRPGRAPVSIVRQRYKNEIRNEVMQNLVPQAISDAITESELHVIGEPELHLDNSAGLNQIGQEPLSVHAHVEVMPDVELGQYRGLELSRSVRPVTDEMVEELIEELRESTSSLDAIEDRGAAAGDRVTVDFVGKYLQPPEAEDIKAEDVDVDLDGEGVLSNFTENLTGTRADDVRTFTVKYPEDFSSKGLAGKEIEYTATVTAVRRKVVPEVDDEWAQSLGEEVETVGALREKLRRDMETGARAESDRRLRDEAMSKLIAAHQFEVPPTLVESQSRHLLETYVRELFQRGIDPRRQDMNWENLRGMIEAQAADDLRGSILLEQIAGAENIEPTDEEIEQEIEALAAMSKQPIAQVRAALTKQGGERSIADRLRHRQALELIVENANVKDEEWREEELLDESDELANEMPPQVETTVRETTATGDTIDARSNAASASDEQQ
ncbi:trigger factor [soil metagenome]